MSSFYSGVNYYEYEATEFNDGTYDDCGSSLCCLNCLIRPRSLSNCLSALL